MPLLWSGIESLKYRLRGLIVGAFLSLCGLAATLAGLAGIVFPPEIYGDQRVRWPLFVLLSVLSVWGVVLHVLGIVARLSDFHEEP
ncbi:MAG: hypothetical protein D6741_19890 [Planctomycetota bacterium]|nr:MAG: hypothetical protein D6741_19890 [Planctomycetota bacterium]